MKRPTASTFPSSAASKAPAARASRTTSAALALCLGLFAGEASACATCAGAMPVRTLNAYLSMTVALSVLPFFLCGAAWATWRYFASRRPDLPDFPDPEGAAAPHS